MPIVSSFWTAAQPLRRFFAALLAASTAVFAQTPSAADAFDPNVDGNVYAIATQPDGKIILAGSFATVRPGGTSGLLRGNLARINPDGSLDATFNPNTNGAVRALALQPDGKIIIGGEFTSLQPNGAAAATARSRLARLNADGTLDPSFTAEVSGTPIATVYSLLLQADGSLIVAGQFSSATPVVGAAVTRRNIVRFLGTGTVDRNYDPNPDNLVFAVVPHVDGKLVIAGGFNNIQANGATTPTLRNRVARLNPDGTPDSEFDPKLDNRATALAVQRDGKILIGGDFSSLQPNGSASAVTHTRLARLNVDGSLDTTFTGNASGNVAAISVQPDGSILVGGAFTTVWSGSTAPSGRPYLARFLPDGTVNLNFSAGANAIVDAFVIQSDGSVIIGGYFTGLQPRGSVGSTVRNRVARINLTGSLDATLDFDFGGRPLVEAVQKDGKILIGGSFTSVGGATHNHLARLNADGSVNAAFKPDFNGLVLAIAVQPADQKILVGGTFTTIGGETRNFIARLNPSGTIDSEFNPNANGQVGAITLQTDGKILLGGSFSTLQPIGLTTAKTRVNVARLNADGSLDAAFHPNTSGPVAAIAIQSDGKIVLGGTFNNVTPEADLTTTTTTAPTVSSDKEDSRSTTSGNITTTTTITIFNNVTTTTVGANSPAIARNSLARFNADGTLDTTFDPNASNSVNALVIQSDGKIVIGGSFSAFRPNGTLVTANRNRLARLNADGTLDPTFDPNVNSLVLALALQADGKILVGGSFTSFTPNGTPSDKWILRKYAARLNTDGTVDPTFDLDLSELNGNRVDSWLVLADGHILIGGNFTSMQPIGAPGRIPRPHFARLNANGTLDSTFLPGVGGTPTAQINAIALQADGKMVVAGAFADLGGTTTANLARFNPEGTPDVSFFPAPGSDGPINALLVRADVAATVPQGTGLAWLNTNGSIRTTFAPPAESRISGSIDALAVQPDGMVVVGGTFTTPSAVPGANLVRFSPAGVIDVNFGPAPNGPVEAIVLQPDGKIIIAGGFTIVAGVTRNYVARLNADGTLDGTFDPSPNGQTTAIGLQADGKVVLGGSFTTLTPNSTTAATTTTTTTTTTPNVPNSTNAVTNANGTTTTTTVTTANGTTTTTVVTAATPTARNYLARVNADGTLDANFNPGPNGTISALLVQADGKIVVGGSFITLQPTTITTSSGGGNSTTTKTNADGSTTTTIVSTSNGVTTTSVTTTITRNRLARLNPDGTPDSYDPNVSDAVLALALNPDGKVIVGGAFTSFSPNGGSPVTRNRIARLNTDGTMDVNFNPNISGSAVVNKIVVQSDAKIIIGGTFTGLQPNGAATASARNRLARINSDGTLDATYNPDANAPINTLALAADGTLVVGGTFTSLSPNSTLFIGGAFNTVGGFPAKNLALLGDDGATNANFLPNPNGAVNVMLAQPDGKIIVGGSFTTISGAARNGLARFNVDNSLDTAFNPNLNAGVGGLALQPDGKVILTGGFTSVGGQPHVAIARLNADGSVDATFGNGAGLIVAGSPTVQGDGKIIVNGIAGGSAISLIRLNTDGSRDTTFTVTGGGTPPSLTPFVLQADGRIIVASTATSKLARFNANGTVDAGFNPAPDNTVTALALQSDGRLLVGGKFSTVSGLPRGGFARLAATTPAVQALSATRTTLVLARSGGGPEISGVTFEQSIDTQTWIKLGNAGRVSGTGNWQLNGLNLPATGLFYIRARAIVPAGGGISSGVIEIIRQFNLAATPGVGPASGSTATEDIAGVLIDSATGLITGQSSSGGTPGMTSQPIGTIAPLTIVPDGFNEGTVRLTNFSARARISAGGVLQTGFAVSGSEPRTLLLRAAGPSLGQFGVTGVLAAPRLQLLDATGNLIRENAGWAANATNLAEVSAAGTRTGAFPFAANAGKDAAMVVTLPPGTYSMQVLDGGGAGGVTLAEIYDADASANGSRLVNLSIRGDVNPGEGAFLSGFVLSGNAARRLLVRGDGPSLTQFGVGGALADPVVNVFNGTGQLLMVNDNWSRTTTGAVSPNATTLATVAHSVGAYALADGSKDAALSLTLVPGTYTVQVTSANTATGAALIEIYELP